MKTTPNEPQTKPTRIGQKAIATILAQEAEHLPVQYSDLTHQNVMNRLAEQRRNLSSTSPSRLRSHSQKLSSKRRLYAFSALAAAAACALAWIVVGGRFLQHHEQRSVPIVKAQTPLNQIGSTSTLELPTNQVEDDSLREPFVGRSSPQVASHDWIAGNLTQLDSRNFDFKFEYQECPTLVFSISKPTPPREESRLRKESEKTKTELQLETLERVKIKQLAIEIDSQELGMLASSLLFN